MSARPRMRRWLLAAVAVTFGACGGGDADVAVEAEVVERSTTSTTRATTAPAAPPLLEVSGELRVREGTEHTFEAHAGDDVEIRIDGGQESREPTIDVLAPSGAVVLGGIVPAGDSVRTVTLPESGTYRVAVSFALVRDDYRIVAGWYTYAVTITPAD